MVNWFCEWMGFVAKLIAIAFNKEYDAIASPPEIIDPVKQRNGVAVFFGFSDCSIKFGSLIKLGIGNWELGKETGRQGDKEDKGTRGTGDNENNSFPHSPHPPLFPSPIP
ncbi:hypothetical protein [Tolypothrix sp. VBCCA 56010]|uniref:hypothetical protein n=1 Tax=Tolypothrix sp. VBCCA 56010 TaxID=3137731 RepID=UPI003D7E6B31